MRKLAELVVALFLVQPAAGCRQDGKQEEQDKTGAVEAEQELARQSSALTALEGKLKKLEEDLARFSEIEKEAEELADRLDKLEARVAALPGPAAQGGTSAPAVQKSKPPLVLDEPVPTGALKKKASAPESPPLPPDPGPQTPDPSPLSLVNLKFTHKIDRTKRLPVEERTEFTVADSRVYCWFVLGNTSLEETEVTLTWKHEGKDVSSLPLRVGPKTSHWRTWAYVGTDKKRVGSWAAEIRDKAGNLVGSGAFTVLP